MKSPKKPNPTTPRMAPEGRHVVLHSAGFTDLYGKTTVYKPKQVFPAAGATVEARDGKRKYIVNQNGSLLRVLG